VSITTILAQDPASVPAVPSSVSAVILQATAELAANLATENAHKLL
jgi:hypothetical protein